MKSLRKSLPRRQFLKAALVSTVAAPLWIPSSAFGRSGVAPNSRVTLGCIGLGGQGLYDMKAFLNDRRVQVVAVCDVDRNHLEAGRKQVEDSYRAQSTSDRFRGCGAYRDFRELLARDDIDAVLIATPDHWHGLMCVWAARAGKDIYCEKPLSLTIAEGRAICDAVQRYGVVLQTGTQRRSNALVRHGCELVRNGRIGRLHTIEVYLPKGYWIKGDYRGNQPEMPIPESFDYDLWLGPAPWVPYTEGRCHFNFRWLLDYSEGFLSDWGAHFYDVAQWGNGTDDTGPLEIKGWGEFPSDGLYDAATDHRVEFTFANGVKMVSTTSQESARLGTHFVGTEGRLWVDVGAIYSDPAAITSSRIRPNEIRLYDSRNHHQNFIDCVLSRQGTAAPAQTGHRAAAISHLAAIAISLGRTLRWDPGRERFENDEEANRMLSRPARSPWSL